MKPLRHMTTGLPALSFVLLFALFVGAAFATAGDIWMVGYPSNAPQASNIPTFVVKMLPAGSSSWQNEPSPTPGYTYNGIAVNSRTGDVWAVSSAGLVTMLPAGRHEWEGKGLLHWILRGVSVNSNTGEVWTIDAGSGFTSNVSAGANVDVWMLPANGSSSDWQSKGTFSTLTFSGGSGIAVNSKTGDIWALGALGSVKMLPAGNGTWQDETPLPSGLYYYSVWHSISINSNTGDVWVLNSDGTVEMLPAGGIAWQHEGTLSPKAAEHSQAPGWSTISVNGQTGDVSVFNYTGGMMVLPAGNGTWQDKGQVADGSIEWDAMAIDSGAVTATSTQNPTSPSTDNSANPQTPSTTKCALGIRSVVNSVPSYCGPNSNWLPQVAENAPCQNNFECLSNQCSNGACINLQAQIQKNQGLLETISDMLNSIWNAIAGILGLSKR